MMKSLAKILFVIFFSSNMYAQCAMCRQNLRSSERSAIIARGIRYGIFSLFFLPYIAVGTVAYLWYKKNKATPEE